MQRRRKRRRSRRRWRGKRNGNIRKGNKRRIEMGKKKKRKEITSVTYLGR